MIIFKELPMKSKTPWLNEISQPRTFAETVRPKSTVTHGEKGQFQLTGEFKEPDQAFLIKNAERSPVVDAGSNRRSHEGEFSRTKDALEVNWKGRGVEFRQGERHPKAAKQIKSGPNKGR